MAKLIEFKNTTTKRIQDAERLAARTANHRENRRAYLCYLCWNHEQKDSVRSRSSTASSSRRKTEAERAPLSVQGEGLKKKLALEKEETELMQRRAEIKATQGVLSSSS